MREKFARLREASRQYQTEIVATLVVLVIVALAGIGYFVVKKAPPAPAPVVAVPTAQVTPPVVQAPPLPTVYRIKKGDTLSRIARDSCNTVAALAKQNFIRNPDKIYAGKKLTFVKSETCSPESAKSRTFPEKRLERPSVRASQEKLLHSEPKSGAKTPKSGAKAQNTTKSTAKNAKKSESSKGTSLPPAVNVPEKQPSKPQLQVKEEGCGNAGAGIADHQKQILAGAECIKQQYGAFIKDAVLQDPRITHIEIVAIMLHESNGNPKAVSRSEVPCLGLMQLQPPTARQYGVHEDMIFDPKENIRGSVRILSAYTYRYFKGSKDHGLAAYNHGPHSKVFRQKNFDPNTLRYVQSVKKISEILTTHRYAL